MTNKTNTPSTMYKITVMEHTRSLTGDKFIQASDLCNRDRSLMTFDSIDAAERAAKKYANRRGIGYVKIGELTTPRLFESLVEIRTA